jgi:DNA replication protein DnaC
MLAIKDNIDEKSEYVSYIKKNVFNADIVIWDEIGTKSLTVFEQENIMSLINARIDAGKSNIYTSNLTDEELLKAVGKRLHSRISLTSKNIELKGKDKRGLQK